MCKICSQNNAIDVILVSLLLTLNVFEILCLCFHSWIWASKYCLRLKEKHRHNQASFLWSKKNNNNNNRKAVSFSKLLIFAGIWRFETKLDIYCVFIFAHLRFCRISTCFFFPKYTLINNFLPVFFLLEKCEQKKLDYKVTEIVFHFFPNIKTLCNSNAKCIIIFCQ